MPKVLICLAEGFEETEAVATADILRRAGIEVVLAALNGEKTVTGSHQMSVLADAAFMDVIDQDYDVLAMPGGPGYVHYEQNEALIGLIQRRNSESKYIAAICAAPTVLGKMGILEDKTAVCFPEMERGLTGARVCYDAVAVDGHIITSRGPGTTVEFALKIVEILAGLETAEEVRSKFTPR